MLNSNIYEFYGQLMIEVWSLESIQFCDIWQKFYDCVFLVDYFDTFKYQLK